MQIKRFVFNPLGENTYVVSDAGLQAVIIDCGALYDEERLSLADYINSNELNVVAHLLTHGHFDHAWGAAFVNERYGIRPRCHTADVPMLANLEEQMRMLMGHAFQCESAPAGVPLNYGDIVNVGSLHFEVFAAPGHTPGGICLYERNEKVLFSGDSLFAGSIGRTDFPGGNHWSLISAMKGLLKKLPDDVTAYPGHGPATTIGQERQSNPYLSF